MRNNPYRNAQNTSMECTECKPHRPPLLFSSSTAFDLASHLSACQSARVQRTLGKSNESSRFLGVGTFGSLPTTTTPPRLNYFASGHHHHPLARTLSLSQAPPPPPQPPPPCIAFASQLTLHHTHAIWLKALSCSTVASCSHYKRT